MCTVAMRIRRHIARYLDNKRSGVPLPGYEYLLICFFISFGRGECKKLKGPEERMRDLFCCLATVITESFHYNGRDVKRALWSRT